ncbi:unnamed protein product, partial [Symbiodinium pilosum]
METVVETGRLRKNSWSEICVEHVVKKVESHLLGCCGRSCGWNGWTCLHWPFIPPAEQDAWKAECCVEANIVRGSAREQMCLSILPDEQAQQKYVEE